MSWNLLSFLYESEDRCRAYDRKEDKPKLISQFRRRRDKGKGRIKVPVIKTELVMDY